MNNIIESPQSRSLRMVKALNAFDAMDDSQLLADEFRLLAETGLAEANFYLGCMYENGNNGLPEDIPLALEQYELAARKIGLLDAYMAQARLFYHGKGGIEKDVCKAKNMYEQIKDYNPNPIACFMLGRIYQYGEGVEKDLSKAESLYKMAIEQGYVYGMLNLAVLYAEKKMHFSNLVMRVRAGFQVFQVSRKNPRDVRLRGG
jgi:hypothetical protein